MKTLFLLRHGNAVSQSSKGDKYRPLSSTGKKEVKNLRKKYSDIFKNIHLVLCSSSLRTRQTLERVMKSLPDRITILYFDSLYLAPVETLFEEVKLIDDSFNNVLIIGHNFGLTDFIKQVCEQHNQVLDHVLHTAEMAKFTLEQERWQEVQASHLQFIQIIKPT